MYTILNPHIIDFVAEPVLYKWAKRRPLQKYKYLLSEAVKDKGYVDVLVDSATSGMVPMHIYTKLPFALRLAFSKREIAIWKKRNNFGEEVKVRFKTQPSDAEKTLILFNYKHYKNAAALKHTCSFFKHAISHLSHYHNATSDQSNALIDISNMHLAADVDIANNPYFKKFFPWYRKPIFILPFAVEERFVVRKDWAERNDRILSVGTFHFVEEMYQTPGKHLEWTEFYETSGAKALHPIRREIFERKEELSFIIDAKNSPYIEKSKGSLLKNLMPTNLKAGQKAYFSFDIVDMFNQYKYAIVGEELITGLPGIGTYEALACGCMVFGDKSCYGGAEITNLVQIENLTVEKCIDLVKENALQPGVHECQLRNDKNYQLVLAQLKNL